MQSTEELVKKLRKFAYTGHPGKMGFECVVDKAFLSEVADRLEYLESTKGIADDFEPITHFFRD